MASVSAEHDRLAASVAPLALMDPTFRIATDTLQPLFPAGGNVGLFIQFENNSSNGYTNAQMEVTDAGGLVVQGAPENLGSIGANSANFSTAISLGFPLADGSTQITLRLTGERGGDVYEDAKTYDVNWASLAV